MLMSKFSDFCFKQKKGGGGGNNISREKVVNKNAHNEKVKSFL